MLYLALLLSFTTLRAQPQHPEPESSMQRWNSFMMTCFFLLQGMAFSEIEKQVINSKKLTQATGIPQLAHTRLLPISFFSPFVTSHDTAEEQKL